MYTAASAIVPTNKIVFFAQSVSWRGADDMADNYGKKKRFTRRIQLRHLHLRRRRCLRCCRVKRTDVTHTHTYAHIIHYSFCYFCRVFFSFRLLHLQPKSFLCVPSIAIDNNTTRSHRSAFDESEWFWHDTTQSTVMWINESARRLTMTTTTTPMRPKPSAKRTFVSFQYFCVAS